MTVTYHLGDTRDVTATIPDGSVSLIATSPPFLCLRSYLPADHPLKHAEIGSEPDPATFLDTLLALTAEWGRVLAPWGSIAVELGDTYAGSGGGGGDYLEGGMREGQQQFAGSAASMRESNAAHWRAKNADRDAWPLAKSLALIPQMYAIALAYGINPLTGQPSPAGRWRVRNVIVWHRPNPAVGALGDKYRPSTSYIVVATRSDKRWFDLTAVRDPTTNTQRLVGGYAMVNGAHEVGLRSLNPAGAPPLDCWTDTWDGSHDTWTITTQPSSLAHYAMWPAKLAERLILSMCPAEVCRECGEPRRRVEKTGGLGRGRTSRNYDAQVRLGEANKMGRFRPPDVATRTPLGWTDCGCNAGWTPGVTLDPFAGTGTTLAVADLHGRDAIGVDIDQRNRDLYPARRAECAKSLFGTRPELPGQLDMFGGDT